MPLAIWILRGFIETIPVELEEAALVDGATRLQAMARIVLPLALPGLAVCATFSFINAWNEFMFALTFMNEESKETLPVVLQTFVGRGQTDWAAVMATSVIYTLPVIALFALLRQAPGHRPHLGGAEGMSAGASYFGNRVPRHVAAGHAGAGRARLHAACCTPSARTTSPTTAGHDARRLVAASHDAGLEVQIAPWGVCQMFGGEAESRFTAHNPEVGQVLETGRRTPVGLPEPPARARVLPRVGRRGDRDRRRPHLLGRAALGRIPSTSACRRSTGAATASTARERFGRELPKELDDEVLAFREESLVDFIARPRGPRRRAGRAPGRAACCR